MLTSVVSLLGNLSSSFFCRLASSARGRLTAQLKQLKKVWGVGNGFTEVIQLQHREELFAYNIKDGLRPMGME